MAAKQEKVIRGQIVAYSLGMNKKNNFSFIISLYRLYNITNQGEKIYT